MEQLGSMDSVPNLTIAIPGYLLYEEIYCSYKTVVYRAVREIDRRAVVIKLLRQEYTTFSELLQFRNQYANAKNIEHSGIVRPYSLEPYRNSYALVMEDFGGISLQQYVRERSLSILEVLEIAVQLADILDGLYQYQTIHKDIKPGHILINPDTKQVKLIDFSIASFLRKETPEIQHPNALEGTLEYLSPEHTGRMNRGIDYRTDFYSLGVTLYELLTGQLPFRSEDSVELVHCHLAKQPTLPHIVNPHIPPILSELVLKLMAKNSEDRYQSALGLKHDLEICLHQFQGTGTIEPFDLGTRDLCDRFLIPEKLYDREAEVNALLAAFDRVSKGSAETILVAGFSGIGKTVLVNEIHKPIVRQRGYFIKGKFDQFNRNIPFSAFVQAFRDLMVQLLCEGDAQLAQWKDKILAALGENAQVMLEVIPELEYLIGQQPSAPELSGIAAQNRFNLLFQQFVQVFTNPEHPLALFLDDLQWADATSLKLMQLLLGESRISYLLLIGSYRDNEIFPNHPLVLTLAEIEKKGAILNTITLTPLSETHLNQLIADTLSCTNEMALPLTQLVAQKTKGNPFFSTQFLKALHDDGLITFNRKRGYWEGDINQVKAKAITDDVIEFMGLRLQRLPENTQKLLKLAACIGNQFDLETLAIISQQSPAEIAPALWQPLQEGLILPIGEVYKFDRDIENAENVSQLPITNYQLLTYKFLHDRVQQALQYLMPEREKRSIHLKISQLLLGSISEIELENKIFEIVNRLNYGIELIDRRQERYRLLKLNLMAGRKAKGTTAYAAAIEYLKVGIKLLGINSWKTDYHLTLSLYEEAIEVAYLSGDFHQMEDWKDILLSAAITVLDKVKTYEIQISACVAQNKLREAIDIALSVLSILRIDFPEQPTPADWEREIQEVTHNLAGKPVASAIDLPLMTDPNSQAALRILLSIDAPTYLTFPELLPLTICKQVNLSLTFGNMAESAKAYANYGLILCSGLGDLETGYQFGQLALNLLEKLSAKEIYARTSFLVNFFIRHWKEPLRQTLNSLQEAYAIALETGDLIHAAIAAEKYCYHAYFAGETLPKLAEKMKTYAEKMMQLKQDVALSTHQIHWQSVLNLLGDTPDPCCLIGQACNEKNISPIFLEKNARTGLYYLYFNKLLLCYLFNDYSQAIEQAEFAKQYLDGVSSQYISFMFYFYDSLTHLAIYFNCSSEQQNEIMARVAADREKMHAWAHHAPMNFQHKYELVAAERHRVLGEKIAAIEGYDTAIKLARENEYLQEEALANELAAKFYLGWGKERIAQSYAIEAYYCYARWGAKAKINDLEKRYPQLLLPILQSKQLNLHCSETLGSNTNPICPIHPSLQLFNCSSNSNLAHLDCAALFKSSQALASAIQLDRLLTTILNTAIANAGASKCVLMLLWDRSLRVEAVTQLGREPIILSGVPVDESIDVPVSLIYRVKHNLKTVVIDNATKEESLLADSYITQHQPKSILCTPIVNQGNPIGILYLENQETIGAFTKDRVQILNLLCCQAAISLENARLYEQLQTYSHQLEIKVAERTVKLEQVNQELSRMVVLDGLTSVFNRRHFDYYLQEQWQQHFLAKQPLGLILCDIDYFKRYNDYYGHQAGDECLKKVAQCLSQLAKRPGDLLARYGGEEFAIVLPDADEQQARQVAESIGWETKRLRLPHAKSPIVSYVTLSAGVSTIVPQPNTSWEILIATADRALYKAKKTGRNRYCFAIDR